MTDDKSNALTTVTGSLGNLPGPVQTTFLAAASRILGGLASFPAAWLRRPVQKFEDTTDARTLVSQGLANALVEQSKDNPEIMRAVANAYLPDVVRKTMNKAQTVGVAAEEYAKLGGATNEDGPDDDWMNKFIRYSEDASSERLQLLFGKILAGELVNPGTFSPATLRAVSELTQPLAEDFQWAWKKNLFQEIWRGPEFERGAAWLRLSRLRDAGLLSPTNAGIHQPAFSPVEEMGGVSLWNIGDGKRVALLVAMKVAGRTWVDIVNFSNVGLEMGRLLPEPDYEANLREVAQALDKTNVAWVRLYKMGQMGEFLWKEPA